jgi:hypothetical protein
MIEITNKTLYKDALGIMEYLFPRGQEITGTIEEDEKMKVLTLFEGMLDFHCFYFVIDIPEKRIRYANGIEQHLGYQHFNLERYFVSIPIPVLQVLNQMALAAHNIASSNKAISRFMDNSVVIDLPLKRLDGKHILTQRSSYVFDLCPKGKITQYLDFFVVLKEIDEVSSNIPISPRVKSKQKLSISLLEEKLNVSILSQFTEDKKMYITKSEKEVLDAFRNNKSVTEISEDLGITQSTVKTLKTRIIQRVEKYFGDKITLNSTKELIHFIDNNGLKL